MFANEYYCLVAGLKEYSLDAARGREMFARLMAELDGKELIDKK